MTSFLQVLAVVGAFARFSLQGGIAALKAFGRLSDLIREIYATLIGALPLGLVAGIALGAVVWMHTHALLARTRTTHLLPGALAAAVLLELAPIGAGLIVAARTGASIGAELGAMRIGEQLDALEMLGVSPMSALVGPRILSCALVVPLLHIFIATLALGSGFIAENIVGSIDWLRYVNACRARLEIDEVCLEGAKTLVFGYLIGLTACFCGLRAEGGTEGVGKAAKQSVVASMILVVVADVYLVGLIHLAG